MSQSRMKDKVSSVASWGDDMKGDDIKTHSVTIVGQVSMNMQVGLNMQVRKSG
jgi:hypothetical protein